MLLEIDLIQDSLIVLLYLSVFLLFYLAYQVGKKIREDNWASMTTGFTIYLISFAIYVLIAGLPSLYPEIEDFLYKIVFLALLIYSGGMIIYTFLTEYEENRYESPKNQKKSFGYTLTCIALVGYFVFTSLAYIGLYDPFISFLIVLIPFIIATNSFMDRFRCLEIVKRRNPNRLFYLGLALSGFSNGLSGIYLLTGKWILFIRYLAVIFGSLLMVHGWRLLPSLSELDWMLKMRQILIVHNQTSSLLFKYTFKEESGNESIDSELAGSAMSGIDSLLSEVLASKGHIEEIEHSGQIVIFLHGKYSLCILIADAPSDEFRYRVEMFHLSFEKHFKDQLRDFSGEITQFQETNTLIREHFSQ